MRLWSLHPRLLDRQGLLAVWREGLLAQQVLADKTRGYKNHPQLRRFRAQPDPLVTIGAYLTAIDAEATVRGYCFDRDKILRPGVASTLTVTTGQLDFERQHLDCKLAQRDPQRRLALAGSIPEPHPLFAVIPGPVEEWEVLP